MSSLCVFIKITHKSGILPIENWLQSLNGNCGYSFHLLVSEISVKHIAIRISIALKNKGITAFTHSIVAAEEAQVLRELAGDKCALYLDDSICWVAPEAVESLVNFQKENPEYLFVHPAIANTVPALFMWQIMGKIPVLKIPKWESDQYCHYTALTEEPVNVGQIIHELFLRAIQTNTRDTWFFNRWINNEFTPPTAEAFYWDNQLWKQLSETHAPGKSLGEIIQRSAFDLNMPCVIHGESQMSYYANSFQKSHFAKTDILRCYREL